MDGGSSKQYHVLVSAKRTIHGWTWFHAVTSLTFCQTRLQALYMDVQRLKVDFRCNRCPGDEDIVKLIKVIFYTHIIIYFYFTVHICIAQFPILVIFIFPYPLPISLLY